MAGEQKRRSAISHPALTPLPTPDGTIGATDRVEQAGWYAGIAPGNPATSFPVISLSMIADSLARSLVVTCDKNTRSLNLVTDTVPLSITITMDG